MSENEVRPRDIQPGDAVTSPENMPQILSTDSKSPFRFMLALEPGTVVQIECGAMEKSRKAWKKRRRTNSPILVPCSILSVDKSAGMRWNLLYLLKKFGQTDKFGILSINESELNRCHRSHLKSSLSKIAQQFGHPSTTEFIEALFPKTFQDDYGIQVMKNENQELELQAALPHRKARQRAQQAALLQFQNDQNDDGKFHHTGRARTRVLADDDNSENNKYRLLLQPLSAALRVRREDIENGTIFEGSQHSAVVVEIEESGDAGVAPLLSLSLNPAINQVRNRLKLRALQSSVPPKILLHDLQIGDRLSGEVVKLVKGGALVECGVGRNEKMQTFGLLRFCDAVGDERYARNFHDDISEKKNWMNDHDDLDIVHEDDESGHQQGGLDDDEEEFMEEKDPDKGMKQIISADLDDYFDEVEAVTEDDGMDYKKDSSSSKVDHSRPRDYRRNHQFRTKTLHPGDRVQVFVKSVSKQTGQFSITMDSLTHDPNIKDQKKKSAIEKKLTRLEKQLGGLYHLDQLRGKECDGTIKAASKSGEWFYVQPDIDLPVGVAKVADNVLDRFEQGDSVRIQVDGVDENRGQLSLRILRKLSP